MKPPNLSRREFLRAIAAGAAACTAGGLTLSCRRKSPRPNILFCISDDQSYPHASAYGTRFVKTPAFDRIAAEGILLHNAYVSAPSCCPSRSSVLTGQDFYRLRETSMNHTVWPEGLTTYPDLLQAAGYAVGFTGSGWGPGNWQVSGRKGSPCGPAFNDITLNPPGRGISPVDYAANFRRFLDRKPPGTPFAFWAGFSEPHRPFERGIGAAHGIVLKEGDVPGFLPDVPDVRGDMADYAFEIQHFDAHLGRIIELLEERGELDDTLIVVTSDNGMAFPRAKGTLYDFGVRMPLAVRWGRKVRPGREVHDFVSFADFAPTFLEVAGVEVPHTMTGKSLVPLFEAGASGGVGFLRDHAVFGLERHFPGSRPHGAGYPMRGIRTADYLYIRNLTPRANPVGDRPGPVWPEDDPVGGYGDTDGSPSKTFLFEHREEYPGLFEKAFGPRPGEELYDVRQDPFNLNNLAGDPSFAEVKEQLSKKLDAHLKATGDPRALGRGAELDDIMKRYPIVGSNR
jgi:N-sulfoglucosamine sulfohydrolase